MVDVTLARLIADGLLGQALAALANIARHRPLTVGEQIQRIELISLTSAKDSCIQQSFHLLKKRQVVGEERVRCLVVAGIGQLKEGSVSEGRAHLRKASTIAASIGVPAACHAKLSEFSALASWVGPEAASIEIAETRRLVAAVAQPGSALQFHLTLAEVAAKQGLLHRADRHLKVGAELLVSFPNRYLECEHAIRSGAIGTLSSDPDRAVEFAEKAIGLALMAGAPTQEVVARSNLAHALLALGRAEACKAQLTQALALCRTGGLAALGIRDGLLQHAIASNNEATAAAIAEETFDRSLLIEDGNSYYGLWHLLTRVKWLYRIGDASGGLAVAMDAIPRIERMADRNLLERMQLLAAEGLGRTGRAAEGAALMAQAVNANPDPPLEMIAEAARVAGRLTAGDDPGAALGHFERAGRILQSVGNLTARAEIERDAGETLTQAAPTAWLTTGGAETPLVMREDPPARRPADLRPAAAPLAERIAALVELAAHPPLLAAETLSLIADTNAVFHAAIIETFPDGRRELITAYSAPGSPAAVDDHPDAVRIVLGTHRDRQYAIAAIPQPTASARATLLSVERLVHTSLTIARTRQQEREQAALWPDHTPEQQLGLVCASERMLDLIKTIRRVAGSTLTVMLTGETGVGKELFARALHLASPRKERTFLPFNCTTVPREMLDSQLFGYRRGAFTGAQDDAPGLVRSAAGGTLFLDEIGEMSADAQPKLLRFLESGEILPLGETRPQLVDVRIVAATNGDLEQLVTAGRFREDLFYRLNVIPIHIPPLRERREEIPALVEHFIERFGRELQKPMLRVADETLEYLLLYRWPGNVRQLSNEIRRIVALAEPGSAILPAHLSAGIVASRRTIPAKPTEIVMRIDQPLTAATEHLERAAIERAMALCDGRIDEAAKMLGLSRKGLYLKRHRLGME